MMTFMPPAWHAAQLPEKTCSPAAMSAAKAGPAASTPAAMAGTAFDMTELAILEMGALNAAAEPMRATKKRFMAA